MFFYALYGSFIFKPYKGIKDIEGLVHEEKNLWKYGLICGEAFSGKNINKLASLVGEAI